MTNDELRAAVARATWAAATGSDPNWIKTEWSDFHPSARQSGYHMADAALAAIRLAGFAIVPVEPTEAMLIIGNVVCGGGASAQDIWTAMLKAAQETER
jgi:hypothetical protein